MPLTSLNFDVSLGWTTATAVTGFDNRTESDQLTFAAESTLANSSLAFWNQNNAQQVTINAAGTADIDCYAFTNLSGGSVTSTTAALGLVVMPSGGHVTITPGATNPLYWFFNGTSTATTAGIVAYNGGCLLNCKPGSDTGTTVVDATHRNLRLTNGGSASITVTVAVILASPSTN